MLIAGFNPLDVVAVVVLLLSSLLAFARGFVREVLSIGAWVGAGLVTLYTFPLVQPMVLAHVDKPLVANSITIVAVFVVALLIFQTLCHTLSALVSDSALSAIDRSLGFAFGMVRGAVLLSLAYMLMSYIWPDNKPEWLTAARSQPALETGAQILRDLAPADLRDKGEAKIDAIKAEAERAQAAKQELDRLQTPAVTPATNAGAPPADRGYNDRERTGLDQLIQNTEDTKKPQ